MKAAEGDNVEKIHEGLARDGTFEAACVGSKMAGWKFVIFYLFCSNKLTCISNTRGKFVILGMHNLLKTLLEIWKEREFTEVALPEVLKVVQMENL